MGNISMFGQEYEWLLKNKVRYRVVSIEMTKRTRHSGERVQADIEVPLDAGDRFSSTVKWYMQGENWGDLGLSHEIDVWRWHRIRGLNIGRIQKLKTEKEVLDALDEAVRNNPDLKGVVQDLKRGWKDGADLPPKPIGTSDDVWAGTGGSGVPHWVSNAYRNTYEGYRVIREEIL